MIKIYFTWMKKSIYDKNVPYWIQIYFDLIKIYFDIMKKGDNENVSSYHLNFYFWNISATIISTPTFCNTHKKKNIWKINWIFLYKMNSFHYYLYKDVGRGDACIEKQKVVERVAGL